MRIALDALGGDHAPQACVEGAVAFARSHPDDEVVLVGPQERLSPLLGGFLPVAKNVVLTHAPQAIEMDEPAGASIRRKRGSSLRCCFDLLKLREVDAVVSAGNSGAVMAGALLVCGRLPEVDRPAIAALFPSLKGAGRTLVLDVGANVECKPRHLLQFGLMGAAYMRALGLAATPRVAVLSNGEEPGKGTPLTRAAAELLSRATGLRFRGYVEGKDLFSGEVDVIATDGFTGNVVLKTSEGTASAVASLIRTAVERSALPERLGALLMAPTLAGLRKMVDYAEYGGAPLLGVDGVVVVAHGRSSGRAIQRALEAAVEHARSGLREAVAEAVAANALLGSRRGESKRS